MTSLMLERKKIVVRLPISTIMIATVKKYD